MEAEKRKYIIDAGRIKTKKEGNAAKYKKTTENKAMQEFKNYIREFIERNLIPEERFGTKANKS